MSNNDDLVEREMYEDWFSPHLKAGDIIFERDKKFPDRYLDGDAQQGWLAWKKRAVLAAIQPQLTQGREDLDTKTCKLFTRDAVRQAIVDGFNTLYASDMAFEAAVDRCYASLATLPHQQVTGLLSEDEAAKFAPLFMDKYKNALLKADAISSKMPSYPENVSVMYGSRIGDNNPKEKTLEALYNAGLMTSSHNCRYHVTDNGKAIIRALQAAMNKGV